MNTLFYNNLPSLLKSKIIKTRWHLGDDNSNNSTYSYNADTMYSHIMSNASVYGANYIDSLIGLPYVTDYMYSVLSNDCNRTIVSYSYHGTIACFNNNWIGQILTSDSTTAYSWTINNLRYYDTTNSYYPYVYSIRHSNGRIYGTNYASNTRYLYPVFYSNNQVKYFKGLGSSTDHYYVL